MIITRTKSAFHEPEREVVIRKQEKYIESEQDGRIGRQYHRVKDKRDRLWTEISKGLVVREAIQRAGYEYEESENFYFVFEHLRYVSQRAHLRMLTI
jgi:hypothetical protein